MGSEVTITQHTLFCFFLVFFQNESGGLRPSRSDAVSRKENSPGRPRGQG